MYPNVIKSKYLKIISFCCASVVPLLVTGPFLPDLTVSLLSIWFLYYSLKNKMYAMYRNIYFYFFSAFCLVCIISSFLSDNIFISLKPSLFYFRIGIFALLISYLIDHYKNILNYFYYAFIITFCSLIIDGYIQYLTGLNLFGFGIRDHGRISSFFGKELILGSYLARLFPLFFALFVARSNKRPLEIYGISFLFILIEVLVFLAGERTSFVLLNVSTIFIVLLIYQYKWLRLWTFIASLGIITLLLVNDPGLYNRYIKSPTESMGLNDKNAEKKIFSPSHDFLLKTAFKMFLDKPIFGHGPQSFRIKCEDFRGLEKNQTCNLHPHNFYAQLLAETGILGFLFLFGLFLYIIFLSMRHILEYFTFKRLLLSDYQICLFAGLLITTFPFTSNGNFFTNHLMLMYGLQLGFFRKKIK